MILAVIPARGGSKRVPRKNERLFRGIPLLAWSVNAAFGSMLIDRVVVSTEDWALGLLAHRYGAEIVRRPDELATDTATNEEVLRHALTLHPAEYVVLLQPTSPLRTAEDIDGCIQLCQETNKPVVSYAETPLKFGGKNGAVYAAPSKWIWIHDFSEGHLRYEMPDSRSLDIDEVSDFDL